jgi:hypothetical protein
MNKRLGILLPCLDHSQRTFTLISSASQNDAPLTIFCEDQIIPTYHYTFPTMSMIHAYPYTGTLIATSLSTANKLNGFPSAFKRYFYIWDLEWLYIKDKKYEELLKIYQSVDLICRSNHHGNIVEKMWNVEVKHVVRDFNLKELGELC